MYLLQLAINQKETQCRNEFNIHMDECTEDPRNEDDFGAILCNFTS